MQQVTTQLDGAGLELKIRLLNKPGANKVEMVEDIRNASNRPVCFALCSWNRRIFQIASGRGGDNRKLVYHREPKDVSEGSDPDSDSSVRIVEGFEEGGGSADGGEVIEPSETKTIPLESFTVLQAGLYRVDSEWSVAILDVREAPRYKVLATCVLKSNVLDFGVANDVQQKSRNGDAASFGKGDKAGDEEKR